MRYSLYTYLNSMCASLKEAAEYIQTDTGGSAAGELLKSCGEVLGAIESALAENGESIREGGIFDAVSRCRERMDSLASAPGNIDRKKAYEFRESTIALKNQYRDGIDVSYSVVFFAELGQKWDSMSSVYEAFKARKDCDVAVVLTPIYRAVNSGEAVKTDVIYEDFLTPLGIGHIPFQQYDIEKAAPDIAFISNPYESVTPRQFWPETIAKHTRLVYLRYYTAMEFSEESIITECRMPVAQCAWRIAAQSKKVRDMHKAYAARKGGNVVVTGLPKWDDTVRLMQGSMTVPAGWEKKLKGKTVFLWNSHYSVNSERSTLLDYGGDMLKLFSQRKDIALIWRPHPMTETIFKLYMPELAEQWNNMKAAVEESENMIFDASTSYNTAFYCSDALISDYSSIIVQYMFTGKPILRLKKARNAQSGPVPEEPKYLVRINSSESASSFGEISGFVGRVVEGIDLNKKERLKAAREDLPNADGHIGERLCRLLLQEMRREDGVESKAGSV